MRRDIGLRTAWLLACLLAALPLAACSGGGSERPASLAVYAEPSLAAPALAAATELLAGLGISVAPAPAPEAHREPVERRPAPSKRCSEINMRAAVGEPLSDQDMTILRSQC
ncbi:MAG: hypothetical protein U1B78_04095 [Dehalococcoidia bacterium]|nr:hypothetical protein [Dehalococcoidia bacterium]